MACIVISAILTNLKNHEYEKKMSQMEKGKEFVGMIVSNPSKKEYTTQYQLQVKEIDNKPCNIMVYVRIKQEANLQYGDEISFRRGIYQTRTSKE